MQFYKQGVGHYFNLLAHDPSTEVPRWIGERIDATWQHRPGSTLAQIMVCCLTSPSHYMNQYWLFVKGVVWHSAESNFIRHAHALNPSNVSGDCILKSLPYHPGDNELKSCTDIWLEVPRKNAFHKIVSEIVLWPFQPRLKSWRKKNFLDLLENCEQ